MLTSRMQEILFMPHNVADMLVMDTIMIACMVTDVQT